jgi:hypothetical protein
VDAAFDRGEREFVIEMDVGNDGDGRAFDNLRYGSRGALVWVAFASAVSVLVIVWTTMGASPPIWTSPTWRGRL